VRAVALGNVYILVRSGPMFDPYFSVLMPDSLVWWWRTWFLLRNNTDALLPAFMGGHPVPHPNWEYGVARADLHRLQHLLEIIRGLLQRGLMGAEILRTFFSHGVRPLHQRDVTVQMSLGPSCPIHPFPMESGGMEINTQVRGTLAPEDVVRREACRVCSEWLWSQRQRRWVEGNSELTCPWVIDTERPSTGASPSADQNILHLFQVSLKGKEKENLSAHPWLSLSFLISSRPCF
jgi:hypothetical protein